MSGCKFYNTIQYNTIQATIIIFGYFFIAKIKNYFGHLNASFGMNYFLISRGAKYEF